MQKAREASAVSLLGHDIQVFEDISPFTAQKRRTLKPLLAALTAKQSNTDGHSHSPCPAPSLTDSIPLHRLQREKPLY